MTKRSFFIIVFFLYAVTIYALDTNEPYNKGFSNTEIYLDASDLNKADEVRGISFSTLLGYGVTDSFSAYYNVGLNSNWSFSQNSTDNNIGLIWQFITSNKVTVDFLMDIVSSDELFFKPGIEVNFDFEPEQSFMGLYTRLYSMFYGQNTKTIENEFMFTFGYYWTIKEGHQLLSELDYNSRYGFDKFGIGYNFLIVPEAELITEFHINDLRVSKPSVGFLLGAVFTLK